MRPRMACRLKKMTRQAERPRNSTVVQTADQRCESGDLLHVPWRQPPQRRLACRFEGHPHHSMVVGIGTADDEPCRLGAVHELTGAVVAQEQLLGDLTDRRSRVVTEPLDHDEELVLRGGEPRGERLLLAPPQEPAQRCSEREQPLVVDIRPSATPHMARISQHDIFVR